MVSLNHTQSSPVEAGDCPSDEALGELLASGQAERAAAPLVAHLDACPSCCGRLEQLAGEGDFLSRASRSLRESARDPFSQSGVFQAARATWSDVESAHDTHDDEALLTCLQPSEREGSLGRLDRYEVLGVVGWGGMGVVLKAYDPELQRPVAIKLMASPLAIAPAAIQRLKREARAVAAVRSEFAVEIHEVRTDGDAPYLVMEYVEGCSLQERINDGPLPIDDTLRIGADVARGLAAAHEKGLVHRDVKPANILLDEVTHKAKLTDFGLARAIDDKSLTRHGAVAGTPEYMSPEQAAGKPVDRRSDLFSLGGVLYAMCAGRPPFAGDTSLAVLRAISQDQPRPLGEVRADAPRGLVQIIERLLQKRPDDRYAGAAELAADLERVPDNPLAAPVKQPPKEPSRRRPARPRAMIIGLAAALLLTASVVGGQAAGFWNLSGAAAAMLGLDDDRVAQAPAEEPKQSADGVDEAGGDADKPLRVQVLGRNALLKAKIQREKDALAEEASPLLVRKLVGHEGPVKGLAYTPNGKQIVSCSGWPTGDRTLRLWDAATGEVVRMLDTSKMPQNPGISGPREAPGELQYLAVTPDGQQVVAGGTGGALCVWETKSGEMVRRFDRHLGTVYGVAISPNGRRVLSCGRESTARLWKLETAEQEYELQGHGSWVRSVAISPDGRYGLTGSYDGFLRLWDLETGKQVKKFGDGNGWVWSCEFSPDGDMAVSANGSAASLWNLETGERVRRFTGHAGPITCVAFSPDGRQLATTSYDHTVRLWRAATGKPEQVYHGHRDWVWRVRFSPDGRQIASAGGGRDDPVDGASPGIDFAIRIWKVP